MGAVVLVTGASAGIGRACARRLAGAGWTVVGASRRGSAEAGWTGLVMDVDDEVSVRTGVAEVLERHGRIDAVVASAGWGLAGAMEQTPIDQAVAQLDTNFFGACRLVQAALPALRRHGGRIVLVSSIGGVVAIPFPAYFCASKFALEGLAEALGYEVRPFGVTVTLVQPGNVRTDFTANRRTVDGDGDGAGPGPGGDDPYRRAREKAVAVMERDEADGVDPDAVAAVVRKVLEARRPPRRVSVGKAGERVGIVAKRLLPQRVFEAAAKGALGVD
ncbi:MAG TPA: SDR family oxidoreductase [Acidimicrobiales bacterium]|nr:SDR family oxidoreductase [Acidimicrobiales bacterium]